MIRTIIIPNTSNFNVALDFPKDYLGEEVEIIAFKRKEGFSERKNAAKRFVSFDAIKIDTSNFKFNRDEANER
jgi:hypothetical protein